MSFDVNVLKSPLTKTEAAELGASDDRLLALDGLAEKGDFAGAAHGVEELLEAGIYDLRPLPYYLYQLFLDGGYAALLTLLEVSENLLGASHDALAPEKRRDDFVNRRFHWLFDKLDGTLAYHEKGKTNEWLRWRSTFSPELLEQLLPTAGRVQELLAPPAYLQAATALGHVLTRLRADEKAAAHEPADKNNADGNSTHAESSTPQSVAALLSSKLTSEHAPVDGLQRVELAVSPRFVQLCRSLEAFEVLVRKEHFAKAAVVLADITESLGNFDPRVHFPSLFAQFASLQSKYVRALSEHSDSQDSPAWQALQQYYRVDLKGFVES